MKQLYQQEYVFNAGSKSFLWKCLSTESGLSHWFADHVEQTTAGSFIFTWKNGSDTAQLLTSRHNEYIRFQWTKDQGSNVYFEFRIHKTEITNLLTLTITDFAEQSEKEDAAILWDAQVEHLRRFMGAQ